MPTVDAPALAAAATCLGYPDEHWQAVLPVLAQRLRDVERPQPLARFLAHAGAAGSAWMAEHYRTLLSPGAPCSAHLTEHGAGDARGALARLAFARAYREAGEELTSGEEPDHLAVVCEFAARHPDEGGALLARHLPALDALHAALAEHGSPYADVVDLVRGSVR